MASAGALAHCLERLREDLDQSSLFELNESQSVVRILPRMLEKIFGLREMLLGGLRKFLRESADPNAKRGEDEHTWNEIEQQVDDSELHIRAAR